MVVTIDIINTHKSIHVRISEGIFSFFLGGVNKRHSLMRPIIHIAHLRV